MPLRGPWAALGVTGLVAEGQLPLDSSGVRHMYRNQCWAVCPGGLAEVAAVLEPVAWLEASLGGDVRRFDGLKRMDREGRATVRSRAGREGLWRKGEDEL